MWEPRGHADMYGCLLVPPITPEADFGVLFMHNAGFSTMCGHGIIGVVTVMLEMGLIVAREPETRVGIDTPAGFVEAHGRSVGGAIEGVRFTNVPSFVAELDAEVDVPGFGAVRYDLAYGGAFYAYVDASDFDLDLVPSEVDRIIDLGRRIKAEVQNAAPPSHPDDSELGFLYGTIFVGPPHGEGAHSRNVCVFADGEVDRSPTGTGVSGRIAIHAARGELPVGEEIRVESILGTTFTGRALSTARVGRRDGIIPEVAGRAHVIGRNEILVDPRDPIGGGFLLR